VVALMGVAPSHPHPPYGRPPLFLEKRGRDGEGVVK